MVAVGRNTRPADRACQSNLSWQAAAGSVVLRQAPVPKGQMYVSVGA